MELKESLERLRELFVGDFEDLQRLGITIVISLILLIIFILISKWIKRLVNHRLDKRLDDSLLANFISLSVRTIILIFGIIVIMRFLGLTAAVGGLLAGAGITAFVIGFALKDIGENFLAGILLAFKRPFRVGDVVEINNLRGKVLALNLRDTQIKSGDGKDIFMPNASIIKNPLINYTLDGFLSHHFTVELKYGTEYDQAIPLIKASLKKVKGVLMGKKQPTVYFSELGIEKIKITITFWVNTYNKNLPDLEVKSNAIFAVLSDLDKAGIQMA